MKIRTLSDAFWKLRDAVFHGPLPFVVTMTFLVTAANFGSAQEKRGIIYAGTKGDDAQLMPLITHVKVRREIGLSPAQHEELKPHLKRWKELFKEERREKFRDQTMWIKILDDILLPHQLERLEQIHWQAMGLHVLGSPHFARRLKLTEEQSHEFDQLRIYIAKESAKISKTGEGTRDHAKMVAEMTKNIQVRVKKLVTKKQLGEFARLLGKPFDMEGISRPNF